MEKQFTIKIPDELYVNSWEQNLTASFTYSGPETLYAVISLVKSEDDVEEVLSILSLEPITNPVFLNTDNYKVVEISANTNTPLAEIIFQRKNSEYVYNYTDFENFDGSVAAVISNPRITDYYTVDYTLNDEKTGYEFKLLPIYKYPQQLNILGEIDRKLELLEYNKTSGGQNQQTLTKINEAIAALNSFKQTIKDERPWKFDKLPDSSAIPPISKALEMSLKPIPVPQPADQPTEQEVSE
jgi:hypothetical protein